MDRIGQFSFVRLDRPPQRASREWEVVARAGVHGVALWDLGQRGTPFQVRSEAVAVNFLQGRSYFANYKTLEVGGAVDCWFGTQEPESLYKVLRVDLDDVRAVVGAYVANDPTIYRALVMATWTLLPINPFVQRPV